MTIELQNALDPSVNEPGIVSLQEQRAEMHLWDFVIAWKDRLSLFARIVWRVWDTYPDGSVYRISASTAWSVASDLHCDTPYRRAWQRAYRRKTGSKASLICHPYFRPGGQCPPGVPGMKTNPTEIRCAHCENVIDPDENYPGGPNGEDDLCADCYCDSTFTCGICGENTDKSQEYQMLLIRNACPGDNGEDVKPGIYQVTGSPCWRSFILSSEIVTHNIKRIADLPSGLVVDPDDYPCASICAKCQKEFPR
jgi:hypothetical protein